MKNKRDALKKILDQGTGERELLAFLKENPYIITKSLTGHEKKSLALRGAQSLTPL